MHRCNDDTLSSRLLIHQKELFTLRGPFVVFHNANWTRQYTKNKEENDDNFFWGYEKSFAISINMPFSAGLMAIKTTYINASRNWSEADQLCTEISIVQNIGGEAGGRYCLRDCDSHFWDCKYRISWEVFFRWLDMFLIVPISCSFEVKSINAHRQSDNWAYIDMVTDIR